jgi:mono/diheme cytochrome c family protein
VTGRAAEAVPGAPLAVLAVLALGLAAGGCRAEPPAPWERAAAALVKRHLTVGGRADQNPVPDTPEMASRGKEAFSHLCATCHGADGLGTDVPFAQAMAPPVPSLASPEVQAYRDGQLHRLIRDGLWPSGMPAARGLLSDEEIWRIVRWLRRLPAAGPGEPSGSATATPPSSP